MTDNSTIITHTKNWLRNFIIEHNICPFAKRVYDNDSIYFRVISSDSLQAQLQLLIETCEKLDSDDAIETSLLIYPNGLDNFDDYLDFLALANALMDKQGYEGIYQLASFHPDYYFEDVDKNDASNYTNRSPYPMLHLIREDSLEKALQHYPHPENIPLRNIEYLREMGANQARSILLQCVKSS
jgi:hypothetical protein